MGGGGRACNGLQTGGKISVVEQCLKIVIQFRDADDFFVPPVSQGQILLNGRIAGHEIGRKKKSYYGKRVGAMSVNTLLHCSYIQHFVDNRQSATPCCCTT